MSMGLTLFLMTYFEYCSSKLYIMPFLFDFKKVFALSTGDFFFLICWVCFEMGEKTVRFYLLF